MLWKKKTCDRLPTYGYVSCHTASIKSPWPPSIGYMESQVAGPHFGSGVWNACVDVSRVDHDAVLFNKLGVHWPQVLLRGVIVEGVVTHRWVDMESLLNLRMSEPCAGCPAGAALVVVQCALEATHRRSSLTWGGGGHADRQIDKQTSSIRRWVF